jgi:hypothetical protein
MSKKKTAAKLPSLKVDTTEVCIDAPRRAAIPDHTFTAAAVARASEA